MSKIGTDLRPEGTPVDEQFVEQEVDYQLTPKEKAEIAQKVKDLFANCEAPVPADPNDGEEGESHV